MSFANGGFEQHHRQDSDGIKPEIGISGWRSSAWRPISPMNWQDGHWCPGQQGSLDCRVKRRSRPPRRPAVPDRHKLFSLDDIAPKLALAPFGFGPLGCRPFARHPPLVEAHGPKSPGRPQSMAGWHVPTTISFRPLFSKKADVLCSV
jgi:hypothetical protein